MPNNNNRAVGWLTLAAAIVFAPPFALTAQAQTTLVSNIGQTTQTRAGLVPDGAAQGIRTGTNAAGYTLTGIELLLQVATTFPTVTLHRGSPTGMKVADFTAPSSAAGFAVYTFTPTTTVTLDPNTGYWVVATGGAFGDLWGVAYPGEDAAPGWSIRDRGQYNDGTGFQDYGDDLANQVRVNGTINAPPPPPPPPPPPANNAPVITTTAPRSVAENTTAVATLAATDADSGDTLTWSKNGGANASAFALTTAGGLTFASAPNFEDPTDTGTDNGYEVTVRVSDGTATDDLALTVNVTDVAEKPDTPTAPSVSATANSTTSLDVSWTAPGLNGGPALTGYDLQYREGVSGPFTDGPQGISGTSTMITGLTTGTAYQVQVRALNGESPSDWSPSGSTSSPPPVVTTTLSVAENTTAVTTLSDSGDTLTWSKNGGADASAFTLTTAGVLRTRPTPAPTTATR